MPTGSDDTLRVGGIKGGGSAAGPPVPTSKLPSVGDGVYEAVEGGPTPYTDFSIDTKYRTDEGLILMPLSAPNANGETRIKVRLHAPVMTKIVKWTAERLGAMPDLPSADTKAANEVLISKDIVPANPTPINGGYAFRVSGTYIYQLLKPISELPMGTTPFDKSTSSDNVVKPVNFDSSLGDSSFAK